MPSNAANINIGFADIVFVLHTEPWWVGRLGFSVDAFDWEYTLEHLGLGTRQHWASYTLRKLLEIHTMTFGAGVLPPKWTG